MESQHAAVLGLQDKGGGDPLKVEWTQATCLPGVRRWWLGSTGRVRGDVHG